MKQNLVTLLCTLGFLQSTCYPAEAQKLLNPWQIALIKRKTHAELVSMVIKSVKLHEQEIDLINANDPDEGILSGRHEDLYKKRNKIFLGTTIKQVRPR